MTDNYSREFENWAINKYGIRIKETDIKWWEERQEIWNACAEMMRGKASELEKELKYAKDTIESRQKWIGDLQEFVANATQARHKAEQELKEYTDEDNKVIQEQQERLDKAVELLKACYIECQAAWEAEGISFSDKNNVEIIDKEVEEFLATVGGFR